MSIKTSKESLNPYKKDNNQPALNKSNNIYLVNWNGIIHQLAETLPDCTLQGDPTLPHCTMDGDPTLLHCTLDDDPTLLHCTLDGDPTLLHCTLDGDPTLLHCTLDGDPTLLHCTLDGDPTLLHCILDTESPSYSFDCQTSNFDSWQRKTKLMYLTICAMALLSRL